MAINIEIEVIDVNTIIATYDLINIYRASSYSGTYSLIGSTSLVYNKTLYVYTDLNGLETGFYKVSYYNSSTLVESTQSAAIQGFYVDYGYNPVTYPPELSLTHDELDIVNRVRDELGDTRMVKRDYYDGTSYNASLGTTLGDNDSWAKVSSDKKTYEMEDRGWPLSILVNGTTYSGSTQPRVQGYSYLMFDSPSAIFTVTGTFSIYYNTFRFSDKEILNAYDRIDYIPGTAGITTIPISWFYLFASIKLLEGEFQADANEAASIADGDTRYSNEAAIAARQKELADLRKRLLKEIEDYKFDLSYNIDGVRVD